MTTSTRGRKGAAPHNFQHTQRMRRRAKSGLTQGFYSPRWNWLSMISEASPALFGPPAKRGCDANRSGSRDVHVVEINSFTQLFEATRSS